jgi:hypothetical protein
VQQSANDIAVERSQHASLPAVLSGAPTMTEKLSPFAGNYTGIGGVGSRGNGTGSISEGIGEQEQIGCDL